MMDGGGPASLPRIRDQHQDQRMKLLVVSGPETLAGTPTMKLFSSSPFPTTTKTTQIITLQPLRPKLQSSNLSPNQIRLPNSTHKNALKITYFCNPNFYSKPNSSITSATQTTSPSTNRNQHHWMVIMKTPYRKLKSKSQIMDFYAKTLARVLGSESEAEIYIYDASCETHFGFCCDIDEQTSQALARLPEVLSVKPDLKIGSTKDYSLPNLHYESNHKDYKGTQEKRLFVTGLPFHTSKTTLLAEFEIYGEVVKAKIPWDPISKKSKGYAFIEYATKEAAGVALKKMNGKIIGGRVIGVVAAESNPPLKKSRPKLVGRGHPNAVRRDQRRPKL